MENEELNRPASEISNTQSSAPATQPSKKMKICKHCGQQVAKNAETCPNCGAKLKKKHGCLIGLIAAALVICGIAGSIFIFSFKPSTNMTFVTKAGGGEAMTLREFEKNIVKKEGPDGDVLRKQYNGANVAYDFTVSNVKIDHVISPSKYTYYQLDAKENVPKVVFYDGESYKEHEWLKTVLVGERLHVEGTVKIEISNGEYVYSIIIEEIRRAD